MFFFHEQARKIGLWVVLFFSAVYVGALISNFMIDGLGEGRPVFWLVFALCCCDLALIVLFVDETWYRRDIASEQQSDSGGERNRLPRVSGLWQIRHHECFLPINQSCWRLLAVFLKPIMIPCMLYYAASFMWAVGINLTSAILFATPVEAGGYGYSLKGIGFLYFTPIVGVAVGKGFGHFFNDWIAYRYARKHGGVFRPEARLWVNYIGAPFMITGSVLIGQALENRLNVGAIINGESITSSVIYCCKLLKIESGWGIFVFGVMIASVGITTYVLDSYPTGSGEVSALMNFTRTVSGLTVGYFQQPWGARSGYGAVFSIQATVVAAAVATLIVLHVFKRDGALEM